MSVSFPSLTIIIVTKGMSGLLETCLRQIPPALKQLKNRVKETTVVVVDNHTPVPLIPPYCGLNLTRLRFDSEMSFSAANNAAFASHPADYVLLLNNDVFLHPDVLFSMWDAMTLNNVGIVGTRLLFPDGRVQHAGVTLSGDSDGGGLHIGYNLNPELCPKVITFPQAVTGACMLVKKEVWSNLGGLDETYHFGGEDIDFCLRARLAGWKIACCPEPASLHLESATPGRVELDETSRKLFLEKWKTKVSHDT